jgi:hypothetical protein
VHSEGEMGAPLALRRRRERPGISTPGSSEVEHGVRGGAFDDRAAALTYQVESDEESEPSGLPNLGFRCCADGP